MKSGNKNCSDSSNGQVINMSVEQNIAAYEAINHHWAHAEQERWSILYNFLMASTILLLAWATVYTTQSNPSFKNIILALLSVGGVVISLLWILIGCRVNNFIKKYGELGERAEDNLKIGLLAPFHAGQDLRAQEINRSISFRSLESLGQIVPSRWFVLIVPALFAVIYIILFVLSWLI